MSAASSLLRRRSWRVLNSLAKQQHHGVRGFATSERSAPSLSPRGLAHDRKSLLPSYGAYRNFATSPAPPEASGGSAVGTGAKVTAVAVTLAALSYAAYLAFDVKPADVTKHLPEAAKGEKEETVCVPVGEGSRASEPPPKPEAREEPAVCNTDSASNNNVFLQVVKETPLLPQAIQEVEREAPHGVVDSGFEIKEVEDVQSSPQAESDVGGNNSTNIDDIEVKNDDELREETGQSLSNAFFVEPEQPPPQTEEKEVVVQALPSAFTIDSIPEAKEEVGQSQPHETVPGSEGQPDRQTNVEELEPDAFRKEMQETATEDDLKEFSDKILYNQTHEDTDEKQAADDSSDLQNVVAETIEAVSDLAEAIQEAGLDLLQPDAEVKVEEVDIVLIPTVPGIAEAYLLDKKESEESGADEYGSEHFFKYAGAIEEAEKRQYESDEQFRELLLKLDEEYQQELREARKLQEEQTEYAKKLEKDLSVEKVRWEEQAKQQLCAAEERAREQLHATEERLRNELKRKEEEAKKDLEKMELLTQARTNAAVTAEKARHIEDTKELHIQVEALHRAFNTRSEGARASHTTHKLAMGAFAFEDAILRGAPLEEEVEFLKQAGGGNDELIDIALQSLPEDALTKGTMTQLQLERMFAHLRGPLRQLALIPAGQGGILTHAIATAAAAMKVREGSGREGVESVIATVEECLAGGDLLQAANILEEGVKGSRAEPIVSDWTRHARYRVIAEQALALVQAHAIAMTAGLA